MTFLDKIMAETRLRVSAALVDLAAIRETASNARESRIKHRLESVLSQKERINIIAEIKRASPSRGPIDLDADIAYAAKTYETGGAAAISVLTEPNYFKGSADDLRTVRDVVAIPVLRKDFVVNAIQIYEAAILGADAILLIAAGLTEPELSFLYGTAEDLGMDTLVEVHNATELNRALELPARIIGVNNRDLRSLDVSLDVSRELIRERRGDSLFVAESGISSRDDVQELAALGYNGFLVGEALMIAADAATSITEWM